MSNDQTCVICGHKVIKDIESKSVPFYYDDNTVICSNCTSKGWSRCSTCNNFFNRNEVNYGEFHLLYSLYKWKEPIIEYKYCSNICFNIEQINDEIAFNNLSLVELQVLNLHHDKSETEKKNMEDSIKTRIHELETYIKELKKEKQLY